MLAAPIVVAQFHWADTPRPQRDALLQELFLSDVEHSVGRYWNECTFGFVDVRTGGQILPMRSIGLPHDTFRDADGELQSRRQRGEVCAAALATWPNLVAGYHPKIAFMFDNPSPAGASRSLLGAMAVLDLGGHHTYMAHEIGHTLGFDHSFNGERVYNDPYCMMSALDFDDFDPRHVRHRPAWSAIPHAVVNAERQFWERFGPMPAAATLFRYLPEFAASSMVVRAGRDQPVLVNALSEAYAGQPVLAVTEVDGITWTAELRIASKWDLGLGNPNGPGAAVVLHRIAPIHPGGPSLVSYMGRIPLQSPTGVVDVQPTNPPANVRLVLDDLAPDLRSATVRFTTRRPPQWGGIVGLAPAGHAVPGALSAAARNADVVDLFWVGPDGGIGHTSWTTTDRRWGPPVSRVPGGSAAAGAVATSSRHADNLDLYWIGPDEGIGHLAWNRPAWGAAYRLVPAGTVSRGALSTSSRTAGNVDLYWIRLDGGVGHIAWNDVP